MSGASIGPPEVPPPRPTLDDTPNNLPRPLTRFIGRQHELAEARRLLGNNRLLTLSGPGGSGKTRLCIRLAAEVAGDFPDGVYFVPLAPVREPGLVPSSIAQHIGLQDSRGRPLLEHLAAHLRERKLLIVLDNFEHLLAAGPVVVELLKGSRALRIVVSSRSSLRVSGEQECPVPPLALPGLQTTSPASIGACESVELFVERAAAATPGFAVDEKNAASIAQIVQRLEGLSLAIELAAARVKLLPPEAILSRLDHALGLLVGGSRDLPDRQQTLRSTISWSYELLSEGARRLLATCSVFRGGASLEMIEWVCKTAVDIGMPVLDGLQELVDQSRCVRRRAPASRATRCWKPSASLRPNAWRRCQKRLGSRNPMQLHSWHWPKKRVAQAAGQMRRSGSTGSSSSTTTFARRSSGIAASRQPIPCAWPRRCPTSGAGAAISRRGGSGCASCSSSSRPRAARASEH